MQERPRGMKASLKLGPSFLIHVEITKRVNSGIGKPWEVFFELRTRFVRVWRAPMASLYLKEETRVFYFTTCLYRVKCITWSILAYVASSMHMHGGR